MQPNVPVPTDSLYKFLALFGLVLMISSLLGTVALVRSSNQQIFEAAKEVAAIGTPQSKEAEDYVKAMQRKAVIAAEDRDGLAWLLAICGAIGVAFSIAGFTRWHKIQPLHDELLELQVAKARMEVHKVNEYRELSPKPEPPKKKWTWPWKPKPETKNPAQAGFFSCSLEPPLSGNCSLRPRHLIFDLAQNEQNPLSPIALCDSLSKFHRDRNFIVSLNPRCP